MPLSPRERQFVVEYLIDFNGTQAAIRCGIPENIAGQTAYRMLTKVEVLEAISEKTQEKLDLAELSIDWVLRQWKQIAEADPREITYTRLECCRHCYGENHCYQWTEPEYREAVAIAQFHVCSKKCKPQCRLAIPPPPAGGFGFDARRPPVEDCPQCKGEGVASVKICDSRHLKGSARRLFAGVKQNKDGSIEVKLRDQDGALANISKYFGMIIDRKEISAPGGGPIQLQNVRAKDLTDDQLAQYIQDERARLASES